MTQQNQKNEPKIKQNKKWGKTPKSYKKIDNTMHNHNMPSKEKKRDTIMTQQKQKNKPKTTL